MTYILTFIVIIFSLAYAMFGSFSAFIKAIPTLPLFLVTFPRDIYLYFKEKKWRIFTDNDCGIVVYGGLFGTGKTLSMVEYVNALYKSYDNLEIVSNVSLNGIPYEDFKYFEQLTDPVEEGKCRVYVCDEFGSLFNSRNYKTNKITETQYTTVLNQLRKEHKLLLISSQRYGMLDKMFRQVTKSFMECNKFYRWFWQFEYDPLDLEYSNDPRLIKPKHLFPNMLFATDKVFAQYDTHEFVCDFDNPIEITDRTDTSSLVNADYKYSAKARSKYYKR